LDLAEPGTEELKIKNSKLKKPKKTANQIWQRLRSESFLISNFELLID
jgi:hypothetical protein